MKKVSLLVAALLAAVASVSAQAAQSLPKSFDVTITLNSLCQINTAPTIAFTYTSFQAAAATASSSFDIQCTSGLPISSITLDTVSTPVTVTDQATGLAYTLTLGTVPFFGNGLAQTINITGSMALGQAGTCTAASCTNATSTNKTRTLTINY